MSWVAIFVGSIGILLYIGLHIAIFINLRKEISIAVLPSVIEPSYRGGFPKIRETHHDRNNSSGSNAHSDYSAGFPSFHHEASNTAMQASA